MATLPFSEFDFMQKYRESFAVCELRRIYAQLPLKEMAEKIRLAFSQKSIFLCRKGSAVLGEFKVFLDNLCLFLLECFVVRGKWVNFVFGGFAVCFYKLGRRDLGFLRCAKYLSVSVLLGLLGLPYISTVVELLNNFWFLQWLSLALKVR